MIPDLPKCRPEPYHLAIQAVKDVSYLLVFNNQPTGQLKDERKGRGGRRTQEERKEGGGGGGGGVRERERRKEEREKGGERERERAEGEREGGKVENGLEREGRVKKEGRDREV